MPASFSAGGAASDGSRGKQVASSLSTKFRTPPPQLHVARSSDSGSSSSAAVVPSKGEGPSSSALVTGPEVATQLPEESDPQTPLSGIYDEDEGVINAKDFEDCEDEPRQSGKAEEEEVDGTTRLKG